MPHGAAREPMHVLGISCFYHDACAVLMRDGEVVAAMQEERFNRDKFSPVFPIQAINACLQQGGITILDVDEIAFYEKMFLKFERTMLSHMAGWPWTLGNFVETMPLWLKDRLAVPFTIEDELSFKKPVLHVKHHLSHAASSFLMSPFERAAIVTVDGVGEYACATWGTGHGTTIDIRAEQHYPHSLGLLYSILTAFLGFPVFAGEGKVMALAEYGKPTHLDAFHKLVDLREDGSFELRTRFFSFNRGTTMHNARFEEIFGPARAEGAPLEPRHKDIACSLQRFTEDVLLKIVRHVHQQTGETKLCLAGGCFLNVTANGRIRDEGPFEQIFIQPAVGDAGGALGAAAFVMHSHLGITRGAPMASCALGDSSSDYQMEVLLRNAKLPFVRLDEAALTATVADRLAAGKIVGWYQGRMEFGPRALGNRSILAHPGLPQTKQRLNDVIKHREAFRPFGASVLADQVGHFFEQESESPFMLMTHSIRPGVADRIPAVAHVNGTCRIQTVTAEHNGIYHQLISAFAARTGIPMVLNTSFNDTEPIVHKPEEALRCWTESGMDCLALGPFFLEKNA
jgi:carbamoyltransferase